MSESVPAGKCKLSTCQFESNDPKREFSLFVYFYVQSDDSTCGVSAIMQPSNKYLRVDFGLSVNPERLNDLKNRLQ